MSSGQVPRWPAFYPRMKKRGRGRIRPARVVLWDSDWRPVWPPVLGGVDLRRPHRIVWTDRRGSRVFTGRYWETVE